MIFRDITADDKQLFNNFNYECSDYVFSYLFMYSELYKLKIAETDNSVIISSGTGKPTFYMPLGDSLHGIDAVLNYCREKGMKPIFNKIPENCVELFKDFKLKIKEDRNSFDYVFRSTDLAKYEGKDFRKQRNNLSSFYKVCTPVYEDNIYNHIEECKAFTLEYYSDMDIIGPTMRMLNNLSLFDCSGGIVTCDGKIQSFCIYEKVSSDTVISHIELSNNQHRGVHAFLIKEMSSRISEEYINKEDDMGLPGLRRFKETYNPYRMIKKFIACHEA